MKNDDVLEDEVKKLLSAGEHAAAAAQLRAAGQSLRAARIYEQIFEPTLAIACYETAHDLVSAVRVALAHHDEAAVDSLVSKALSRGQGDGLLSMLQAAGRHREVGRVWRARGELHAAAVALQNAGQLAEAAACLEELGQAREAGLLLEAWLEHNDADADAAVRLGRILARFGRHEDAVALLQRALGAVGAADRDLWLCRAAPTMALSFVTLGLREAARATLTRWREAHDRLSALARDDAPTQAALADPPPASLQHLLASARAAAFAAVQTSSAPAPGSSPSTPTASDPSLHHGDGGEARLLLNGRYLLGEPLGGSGTGQVFRAHDAFADRPVAVKLLSADVVRAQAAESWAREVRAAAALGHPAFVRLVELNLSQGFVVTDLLGEGDGAVLLEDLLQQGGQGDWLMPLVQHTLDALAAAHRTGLVHGGLKPHNMFVLPGGVRLVDVGAHRLAALRATETGGLASVWPYLSPEQLMGAPADVDGDLYAVAAIAYRALTGKAPYDGPTMDRTSPPVPAHLVLPAVPTAWSTFLARALSPARGERFASAEDFRAALPSSPPGTLPRADVVKKNQGPHIPTTTTTTSERYVAQGLVARLGSEDDTVKVFTARDAVVGRSVFLLVASKPKRGQLAPYVAAARLWRGVQPVYDVLFDDDGAVRAVVVAGEATPELDHGDNHPHDQQQRHDDDDDDRRAAASEPGHDPALSPHRTAAARDFAALRAVPQSLARDLCAVADALTALHDAGVAVGGFDVDRARGPIGPRLTLAPAPLLIPATQKAIDDDAASFSRLVEVAFDVYDDPNLDKRARLLAALSDGRFLERDDLAALANAPDEPWVRFLPRLVDRLVAAAPARVIARLVRGLIQGH
jgi:serine/threonine protein kinase